MIVLLEAPITTHTVDPSWWRRHRVAVHDLLAVRTHHIHCVVRGSRSSFYRVISIALRGTLCRPIQNDLLSIRVSRKLGLTTRHRRRIESTSSSLAPQRVQNRLYGYCRTASRPIQRRRMHRKRRPGLSGHWLIPNDTGAAYILYR